MAYPVRSKGSLRWTPPSADPQVELRGHCHDYWFADARESRESVDPREPPTPGEWFWREATVSGIDLVPELRGAVMTRRAYPIDSAVNLIPHDGELARLPWYDGTTNPDGVWQTLYQEALGVRVAHLAPANGSPDGYLMTRVYAPAQRTFQFIYQLLTPSFSAGEHEPSGIWIEVGCRLARSGGTHSFKLSLPNPHRDDETSRWWTLKRGNTVLDRIRASSIESVERQGETSIDWIRVSPVCGRLVIETSKRNDAWVYYPKGGIWPRSGYVSIRVYGCEGWVCYGIVLYDDTCAVAGPVMPVGGLYAVAGGAHVRAVLPGANIASYSGAIQVVGEREVRPVVTVVNSDAIDQATIGLHTYEGRRRTPLLYKLVAVHEPTLTTPPAVEPTDLAADVERVVITYEASGYGTTAEVELRNWQPGQDDTYDLDAVRAMLAGMGRLDIRLAHQYAGEDPDDDWATVFTGYLTDPTPSDTNDLFPALTLRFQDRSCLWENGYATMAELPSPGGWDFREYARLILEHHGVLAGAIEFPADYPEPVSGISRWPIPWQKGSDALKFDPETELVDALNRICTLCWMRWRIRPDGVIQFRWWPDVVGDPVLTLTDDSLVPEDAVERPASYATSYPDAPNAVKVFGRRSDGRLVASYLLYMPALTDEQHPHYVGRELCRVKVEEDNPEPSRTAYRELYEGLVTGRELTLPIVGKPVFPGDFVECNIDRYGIAEGTVMKVVGKRTRLEPARGRLAWIDDLTVRPVVGDLDV